VATVVSRGKGSIMIMTTRKFLIRILMLLTHTVDGDDENPKMNP
jgi:hypothetical protein